MGDYAFECYAAIAERLLNNGWNPIPWLGKEPCIAWREYQRRQPAHIEVLAWQRQFGFVNVGFPMGPVTGVVALDFDADDAVEAMRLADISDEVFKPSQIVRVGRYPRQLRLYRATRIRTQSIGHVQILSRGQVAVLHGIHPLTGQPYRHVGMASPLDISPSDLPQITRAQVELFRRAVEGTVERRPSHRRGPGTGPTGMTYADAINGVTQGRRHQAMLCIASACRGWGHSKAKASEAVTLAAARCTPPYPVAEALDLVGWCYAHLPAGALPPAPHGIPTVLWIAYQHARVNAHPDGSQRYRLFVSMARDLQRLRAAEPIVLPQPLLAQILGCSHQAISRMIHRALDDDSLLVIADSNYRPGALAKRYRYVGEIG